MKPEIKEKQEERYRNTENMEQRYKAWTENLAGLFALAVTVGQEVGGDRFLDRMDEAMLEFSKLTAQKWKDAAGIEESETNLDCLKIGQVFDAMDDSLANFWDGYIEKSPEVFEKCVHTCPAAEAFSMAPVICERFIPSGCQGLLETLNPKATIHFTKLMPKGDDMCCYRIKTED